MEALYSHIEKRVKELGYSDYSLQGVLIKMDSQQMKYSFKAYNQLFFLISQLPTGSRIISDINAIDIDESFNNSIFRNFYEFSGLIEISLSEATEGAIEFLRVIPK